MGDQDRIDLWLVTSEILSTVTDVSISAAPLTDHCVIGITMKPGNDHKFRKNYWKFNFS